MKIIKNIFLVDDDKVFTFITTKIIMETHLVEKVKVFENGLDILNFLKENAPNLEVLPEVILLDLNMPIMDGWQFLERYAKFAPEIDKKIKIYVLSSSIFLEDIERAKASTLVSDYITKPINKEKLIEISKNL